MRLLLDTHALLWAIAKSGELSARAKQEITSPRNEIFVSAVSLWEIALKCGVGKLNINFFDIENIPEYCEQMDFELISLEPEDALSSLRLQQKDNHKDPFDRMLIYQCIKNDYVFVSKDSKIKAYEKDGLKRIW
jgi:PIN domain nuclease of toxin-antitoxin system